jgi:hypothetical protein
MNCLPRNLAMSLRTKPAVGRTRSQKPSLESLEERALLSANPATLPLGGAPYAAVSSRSTAIIAGADLGQRTSIPVLSLNSIHGGHVKGVTVHFMQVRHAVAK